MYPVAGDPYAQWLAQGGAAAVGPVSGMAGVFRDWLQRPEPSMDAFGVAAAGPLVNAAKAYGWLKSQHPMTQAALATAPIPVVGDLAGLAADARMYASEPESRTLGNAGLSMLGLLPFVPGPAGIVRPERARQLATKIELPADEVFQRAVQNTPGAEITPEGLRMRIARRQPMEAEAAQSVRTGVFYLPEGDKRMSFYGGKTGYGGSEKFSGETLFARPLFVKGATGGKAPENAYNMINGKGAYDAMRNDVLRALPFSGGRDAKIKAVSDLLEKYGADPNLAYAIVDTQKSGNLLPYAVQENIVAHAVRGAGYDAVLGHSKSKQGEFISEIFDVRELSYPSHVMDTEIHELFEP